MKRLFATLVIAAWCSGCASVPFQPIRYVPVADLQPLEVRDRFKMAVASRFQLLNTVVFQFWGRKMSALAFVDVDASEKTFAAAFMTPICVKLFEVAGADDRIECRFALGEFSRRRDLVRDIGEDIKRMYLHLGPGPEATFRKTKSTIVFSQPCKKGHIKYIFAGADGVLVGKRFYEGRRLVCKIGFYEYREENGKLYPGGIALWNYKYRYRLIVRLKEVRK